MQIIRQLPIANEFHTAVAIGNFDGVHLGHRAVIKAMVRAARGHLSVPSVLTFEPHPRRFFKPTAPDFRITTVRDKFTQLRSLGVQHAYAPRFDSAFANTLPEEFLERVLGQQLNARVVVVGEGFVFGRQRRGTTKMLKSWGAAHQKKIVIVPAIEIAGEICSSSAVRRAIAAGDVGAASVLLGRSYKISGQVIRGEGRGHGLGFPTANIAPAPGLLLPAFGVYAAQVRIGQMLYPAVVNLGLRPTMGSYTHPLLEVHVLDVRQDMYGKWMDVALLHHLRPEMKFDGVEKLVAQIGQDCQMTRDMLLVNHA